MGAVGTLGKYFLFVGENITHTKNTIIMTIFRFMIIENSDNNYSGSVLPVCSREHHSNDENYSINIDQEERQYDGNNHNQ